MEKEFTRDVELDAALVQASMRGGLGAFMHAAMALGFDGPDSALARAEWFKRQDESYIESVAERVASLEEIKR